MAGVVDSHRRCGCRRGRCEMEEAAKGVGLLDLRRQARAQQRAEYVQGIDMIRKDEVV